MNIIEKLWIIRGPWKWELKEDFDCMVDVEGDEIINDGSSHGEYSQTIKGDSENARLIAAAPEMLEALIELIIDEDDINPFTYEGANLLNLHSKMVKIIEKATGKKWQEIQELIK